MADADALRRLLAAVPCEARRDPYYADAGDCGSCEACRVRALAEPIAAVVEAAAGAVWEQVDSGRGDRLHQALEDALDALDEEVGHAG